MSHKIITHLLALVCLNAVAACAKHDASSAAAAAPGASTAAKQTNVCDSNLITAQDLSDIFTVPMTGRESVPGDAQSCKFKSAGYTSLDLTVRPGAGHASVQEYVDGKVPVPATPLAGVGDRAMWQADLHEVIAEKNNELCDIKLMGGTSDLKDPAPAAMQKKIGALCNKIFAAQ